MSRQLFKNTDELNSIINPILERNNVIGELKFYSNSGRNILTYGVTMEFTDSENNVMEVTFMGLEVDSSTTDIKDVNILNAIEEITFELYLTFYDLYYKIDKLIDKLNEHNGVIIDSDVSCQKDKKGDVYVLCRSTVMCELHDLNNAIYDKIDYMVDDINQDLAMTLACITYRGFRKPIISSSEVPNILRIYQ